MLFHCLLVRVGESVEGSIFGLLAAQFEVSDNFITTLWDVVVCLVVPPMGVLHNGEKITIRNTSGPHSFWPCSLYPATLMGLFTNYYPGLLLSVRHQMQQFPSPKQGLKIEVENSQCPLGRLAIAGPYKCVL